MGYSPSGRVPLKPFGVLGWIGCLLGTSRLENLRHNLQAVEKGPLPAELVERVRGAFRHHGAWWESVI